MAAGLKYVSLHDSGGYDMAARRYLEALAGSGLPVTWMPMVFGNGWGLGYEPYRGESIADSRIGHLYGRTTGYDTVLVHTIPEYYPKWRALEPGKRMIGYTTWETERLPPHWPALLDAMDLLLVPCEWNREVFRANGVKTPIEVIPHIAHGGPFPPKTPRDELVFYTIGDWTVRKAIWNVIEAFCRAFRSTDGVRLVVKTSRRDFTRGRYLGRVLGAAVAARRLLARHGGHAPVDLVADKVSEAEIDRLHAAGDCFVWLGYGEGWSIPTFDAAAFGNAVIASRSGGPLAYLDPDSAYLVECSLGPLDRREAASYASTPLWSIPNLDRAAELMREVYACREQAAERARALSGSVRGRYAPSEVLPRLLSALGGQGS